jgi:putative ABC transport system permease protein
MQTLVRDLRYGVRSLIKAPGFATVAILTMALGIGANAAIFSIVNALLIKALPYDHPERLVTVWQDLRGRGGPADEWATPGNYADWRKEKSLFEGVAVLTGMRPTLTGAGEPLPVPGEQVSHEYFSVLGVAPALGRGFSQADDVPNAPRVAIISHGLWTRLFGADRGIVGRAMTLNGEPHEIVGVLPPGFRPIVNATADIWRPLRLNTVTPSRGAVVLRVVARLPMDLPLSRAQAAATTLARQLEAAYPQYNQKTGINLIPLHQRVVGDIRPGLLVLFGAVAFVLLIACSNIANLLLARGSAREREIAVRIAIGAARARLIRQLLTESLLLSVAGGAAGVLLSTWAIEGLVAMAPANTPRLSEIRLDATVLVFTTLVTLATGVLFGLLPAAQLSRSDVTSSLKEGARGSAGGSGRRLRQTLIAAEVALALVLLTGGGLLLQTLVRLQHANLGFNPENVLTGFVNPPRATYDTMAKHRAFYDQVLERAAALPGVRKAALASVLPLSGDSDTSFGIEGRPEPQSQSETPVTWYRLVSAGYFETMEMPLVRGHAFVAGEAAPSVVVNESFGRRYFPGTDPIGHRLRFGGPQAPWFTITGIVADAKVRGAREAARIEAFIPYWQMTEPGMNVLLKTGTTPGSLATALKQAVYAIDGSVPVSGIGTLDELVTDSIEQPRFFALLAGGFAALALTLAAIGLYGLLSYSVAQRRAEIGVRMALGATSREVFRLVIGDGLKLVAIGVVVGLVGSAAAMQSLSTLLFGVRALDPATFAGTSIVLLAVAALAGFAPARRAMRVDPIVTLRSE